MVGSGIRKKPIPDPGGKKVLDPRSRIRNTAVNPHLIESNSRGYGRGHTLKCPLVGVQSALYKNSRG
jgi:hypothetical protein